MYADLLSSQSSHRTLSESSYKRNKFSNKETYAFGRVVIVEFFHFAIAIYKAEKAGEPLEARWSAYESSDS